MKRYIVIESTDTNFIDNLFEIEAEIRSEMVLPFTTDMYRCVMHDGVTVKLVHDDKIIIGMLR